MLKPISSGLSPNTEKDDIVVAMRLTLQPWKWNDQTPLAELTNWFSQRFFSKKVYLLNAGRSALYLLLKAAGIGKGDEVIVQSFTCIGAVEPILWVGAKPVYVDIEKETFNLNPADLAGKITGKSKAIIVQHTFGIPADIHKIDKISRRRRLLLIEDCAHTLGAQIGKKEVGTFGDAAFFSFGRDKVVSSVFGGAAIVHQPAKFREIDLLYKKLASPSKAWTLQQLLHPLASTIVLPTYRLVVGKLFLLLLQQLNLLSKPYSLGEYRGIKPQNYPQKLPSALAALALNQLKKLDKFNEKRRQIAAKYGKIEDGAIYLRYPILVDGPQAVYEKGRKRGVILGRWYANIIDPHEADLSKFHYQQGSCPVAEELATKVVNLPTYPRMTEKDILKVKSVFKLV